MSPINSENKIEKIKKLRKNKLVALIKAGIENISVYIIFQRPLNFLTILKIRNTLNILKIDYIWFIKEKLLYTKIISIIELHTIKKSNLNFINVHIPTILNIIFKTKSKYF